MKIKKILKITINILLKGFGLGFIIAIILLLFMKPETLSSIGSNYFTFHSAKSDLELRSLAVNITKNCDNEKYCQFTSLVSYFNTFNYIDSGTNKYDLYTIKQTIKDKAGDCKNLAYSFNALAFQINLKSKVECGNKHCWNIVYLEDYGEIFYDPANKYFIILEE